MTVVDLPKPRLRSYSAMTTYIECGEQYRLKYVEGHRDDPAVWNVGGVAFHQVAEWLMAGDLGADPDEARLLNAWQAAWQIAKDEVFERNPNAHPDMGTWRAANKGKESVAWWQTNGYQMVLDLAGWRKTRARDLVVLSDAERKYIEHRFEVTLGGVGVVAIPDLLVLDEHGQLNIVDWKSGRRAPSGSLQLGVYRATVLAGLGLDAVWGHYYMTRSAELIPHDLTVWKPAVIGGMFSDFDTREKAGDYPAKPGSHCRFCGVRDHCTYKGAN